jgi:hypothetical protein
MENSKLGASVELRHHKFAMSKRLGCREPSIRCADDHIEQRIASLIERHLALQNCRDVNVDVLFHRGDRLRITRKLDYRFDGIADDISLAGWE